MGFSPDVDFQVKWVSNNEELISQRKGPFTIIRRQFYNFHYDKDMQWICTDTRMSSWNFCMACVWNRTLTSKADISSVMCFSSKDHGLQQACVDLLDFPMLKLSLYWKHPKQTVILQKNISICCHNQYQCLLVIFKFHPASSKYLLPDGESNPGHGGESAGS